MVYNRIPDEYSEINCSLKPTCFDCKDAEIEAETKKVYGYDNMVISYTNIVCRHSAVCKYYLAATAEPTVTEMVMDRKNRGFGDGY